MFRICLPLLMFLLIAFSSASATAREFRLSGPGGESCPESIKDAAEPTRRKSAPVRETKAKPSVHSDAGTSGRLQSPRWHSFLPGMFR